jgi:hypothetical protein
MIVFSYGEILAKRIFPFSSSLLLLHSALVVVVVIAGMARKLSYYSSDCMLLPLPCEVVHNSFVLKWKLKKSFLKLLCNIDDVV